MSEIRYDELWQRAKPLVTACRKNLSRFADPGRKLRGADDRGVALMHPRKPSRRPHVLLRLVTEAGDDVQVQVDLVDAARLTYEQGRAYIDNMMKMTVNDLAKRHRKRSPLILPDAAGTFHA